MSNKESRTRSQWRSQNPVWIRVVLVLLFPYIFIPIELVAHYREGRTRWQRRNDQKRYAQVWYVLLWLTILSWIFWNKKDTIPVVKNTQAVVSSGVVEKSVVEEKKWYKILDMIEKTPDEIKKVLGEWWSGAKVSNNTVCEKKSCYEMRYKSWSVYIIYIENKSDIINFHFYAPNKLQLKDEDVLSFLWLPYTKPLKTTDAGIFWKNIEWIYQVDAISYWEETNVSMIDIRNTNPNKEAEEKEAKINRQFNPRDWSHRDLVKLTKLVMNDPDSFEHVDTRYFDDKDWIIVIMQYRWKNWFWAKILTSVKAKFSYDGDIIKVYE